MEVLGLVRLTSGSINALVGISGFLLARHCKNLGSDTCGDTYKDLHLDSAFAVQTHLGSQIHIVTSESFHDDLIVEAMVRPIPDWPMPDMLDVLLVFCREVYGPELAREKAIVAITRQRTKGLETYGQLLNADTPINFSKEQEDELTDAAVYQRGCNKP